MVGKRVSVTKAKQPLYEIVRDRILSDIIELDLEPGTPFATERDLCSRYKVGRNTVRKAIGELESAGYIIRRQKLGIIVTEKLTLPVSDDRVEVDRGAGAKNRIIFILPAWDNTAGNYFADKVFRELSSNVKSLRQYHFELKPYNDSLDGVAGDVAAVLVVDPPQKLIPKLSTLANNGTRIIAVDPRYPLFMADNIFSDSYRGAFEVVEYLQSMGKSKIGLITGTNHHVFQQWLHGFIDVHKKLNLPIDPQSIIIVDSRNSNPQPDLSTISTWLCTFAAGVDIIARVCNRMGLKVPEDVTIIGTDDPGDARLPSIESALTIIRPDYDYLVKLVRSILNDPKRAVHGEIQSYPMKWTHRESGSA